MRNRRFILTGLVLTLLASFGQQAGWFGPAERWAYDVRARNCQKFMPPPSDKLLHVDIDDRSLQEIGQWPWPRSIMADIVGELDAGGAQVIGLDILYYDPSSTRLVKQSDGSTIEIDDDARLAAAIKKCGRVILSGERSTGPGQIGVLPLFADAAAGLGFVERIPSQDGIERQLPIVRRRGGEAPTFSADLQLACAALGADIRKDVLVEDNGIRLHPANGHEVVIPLAWTIDGTGLIQVPYFGTSDWTTAFDSPAHRQSKQHIPAGKIYEAVALRHKIETNNRTAERAIAVLKDMFSDPTLKAAPPDASDRPRYRSRIQSAIDELKSILDEPDGVGPEFDAVKALRDIQHTNDQIEQRITQSEIWVRRHVQDRVVLVGWMATGTTDYYPTPIHRACPGVVIRGTAVNGVLTGELWRYAPRWLDWLVTIVLGALMVVIAARVQPPWALLWAIILCILYALVNAFLVFDLGNVILGMFGPITAVAVVTLAALVMRGERSRPQPQ
jgi:CHASE2 domain-containing sensor protein